MTKTKNYKDLSPKMKDLYYKFGFRFLDGEGKPYYHNIFTGKTCRVISPTKLKELKDGATPKRYGMVKLKQKDGNFKDWHSHRLTGRFIPNPDNKPVLHHIENDRRKNGIFDLAWATYSENNQIAWDERKKKGR